MAELLLVNPRRRRRSGGRRRRSRRRLSPAQIAAGFGGGRRRHTRRRRRRAAALAGPVVRRRTRRIGRRRGRRRSFRRRMSFGGGSMNLNSFLRDTLVPSGIGAAGAIGADLLLGYLGPNLPTFLTTGVAVPLTRIAAAVGLGMAAQAVTKDRRMAEQVMAGAITVTIYGYVKDMIKAQFPTLPLSGMGMYTAGFGYAGPALAYPDMGGMGMYVAAQPRVNPALIAAAQASRRVVQPAPRLSGIGVDEYIEGGYSYA